MSTAFKERLAQESAAVRGGLPDSVVPADARDAALQRALAAGLPGLREEGWRYASLRPLNEAPLASVPAGEESAAASLLPEALGGFARLVYVNGRLARNLSADVTSLPGLQPRTKPVDAEHFTTATADERFAWLNDAFAVDGAQFDLRGELQLELVFVALAGETAGAAHPRITLQLAAGSKLTLIERHVGGTEGRLVNALVQLGIGRDATLEHIRLQDCAPGALFLDSLLAKLDAGSLYTLTQLQLGAASARSGVRIDLDGEAASLDLRGLSLTDARRVHDAAIQVTHRGRRTKSEQLLRAIAKGRSGTSFASRVDVASTAGGADSQQSLKGLIVDAGAEVNLRPQLEISTDEVKASHGATTGALDANMLFYLLSRGLDAQTARQLLEWAFLEDVISRIGLSTLRRQAELATLSHLGNTAAEEALR
ncbi:MAG: hypothetical protein RLZZ200_1533 [Pseudomonadota bacterium]|jgi:Fe-S cluster assembly protein SufD